MKKLISAAAAMAMAASMVGSAVPFVTGAADTAGLSLEIFTNRDGKTKASTLFPYTTLFRSIGRAHV